MHKLKFPDKISRKRAADKIAVYAMWGTSQDDPRPKNKREVAELLLSKKIQPDRFAESCREYKKAIPEFENLAGPTWFVSKGAVVQVVDDDGEIIHRTVGPGQVSTSQYQEAFIAAANAKNKAVEDSSYSEFLSAIIFGISSIESYLNFKAAKWNKANPEKALIDTAQEKTNIEDKIYLWIPAMCSGRTIMKDTKDWAYFKELKEIRDNEAIHPKKGGSGIDYLKLASLIDKFRFGIAKLLGEIHLCFDQAIPSPIINTVYYPDVDVIEVPDDE